MDRLGERRVILDKELLVNALSSLGCPDAQSVANLVDEVLEDVILARPTLGEQLTTDRGKHYGHPSDNFRRIGIKWQATLDLDCPIPPELVAVMMMDVKTARLVSDPTHEDSINDLEGYGQTLRLLGR